MRKSWASRDVYKRQVWDHGSGSIDGVANDENYNFDALTLAEMDGALNLSLIHI